jgi:hypothetical protein
MQCLRVSYMHTISWVIVQYFKISYNIVASLSARGTALAREKNGKFGGKRPVEFAFKMAGQCSASFLYYLYYY